MMMAHDSSSGSGALAAETTEAVRGALVDYIDAPHHDTALGSALHRMAREAREKSMPPEQVLVVLKDIWYSLPDVRDVKEHADQVRLLQRAVTMCIREYYAD